VAHSGGYIDERAMNATLWLGYLILLPGFIVGGTVLWIASLVVAWRRRDLPGMGVAAWNTFAEASNLYGSVSGVSGAFKSIGSPASDADEDEAKVAVIVIVIVVLIVVTALAAGLITTDLIRRPYAGSRPLPQRAVEAAA
jgi:hypothetical protein